MLLSEREIASLVIIVGAIAIAFFSSGFRAGMPGLLRQVMDKRILTSMGVYLLFATLLFTAMIHFNIVGWFFLKEFIVIVLATLPIYANAAIHSKSGLSVTWGLVRSVLGFGAILTAYLSVASFPLPIELIGQLVLVLGTILFYASLAYLESKPDSGDSDAMRAVKNTGGVLVLGLIAVAVINTAIQIADWNTQRWSITLVTFVFSIVSTLAFLPMVYLFAWYANFESANKMISWHRRKDSTSTVVPFRVKMAIFLGTRLSIKYSNFLKASWLIELSRANTYREASEVMRALRRNKGGFDKRGNPDLSTVIE